MWQVDSMAVHHTRGRFSRLVVYILCANNNKSETVLSGGVSRFGTGRKGRKHQGVGLTTHDNDVSSVTTGSSTHNERIERG